MVPNDPAIFLSFLNTRLRDDGCTLEELCAQLDVEQSGVEDKLAAIGYTYHRERNQFL